MSCSICGGWERLITHDGPPLCRDCIAEAVRNAALVTDAPVIMMTDDEVRRRLRGETASDGVTWTIRRVEP